MASSMTRLDYCQFLLSSQINYTLTYFAEHSRRFSHDLANRYLAGERITPLAALGERARPRRAQ